MKDAVGRTIDYVRISLTDLCNFRCVYCMPPEGVKKIPHPEMLRFEELLGLVRLMGTRLGISKVRITGGEPLVRRGVIGFLRDLCRLPGLRDVSLTTNGYLLEEMAGEIRGAGVGRLNISLDTLRPDRFREITRVDGLDQVLGGIDAARSAGFSPIKLNVVALRENLDEVVDFISFGLEEGLEVRFIERMPFGEERYGTFVPNREVIRRIRSRYVLTPLPSPACDHSPAVRYRIDARNVCCGFISPVSAPFCIRCNRLRLRGDGRLLPCLRGQTAFDLRPYIRPEFLADKLEAAIRGIVAVDPKESKPVGIQRPMSVIGG